MSHSVARVRRLHNLLNIPVQRNGLPYLSTHRSDAAQHAASQIFAPMVAFAVILCLTSVPLTALLIIIRFAALLHIQQFCEYLWLCLNPLCFMKSDE